MQINNQWFEKHQNILLKLINNKLVRFLLGVEKMGHRLKGITVEKITPYSVRYVVNIKGNKVKFKEQFFTRPEYAIKTAKFLSFFIPFTSVPYPSGNLQFNFRFGYTTLTTYSNGSSDPVDGYSYNLTTTSSFSTLRGGNGNGSSNGSSCDSYLHNNNNNTQWQILVRGKYCFDTSSIATGNTISSATLSLYPRKTAADDFNCANALYIVAAGGNATTCANGDYQAIGSTSFGSKSYASWNNSGYNDISLNASGISAINKGTGARSNFAGRFTADYDGTTSPTNVAGDKYSGYYIVSASTGSNKPRLVVEHTAIVGPANLKSYNTNLAANIKSINTNLIANVKSLDTNI